MISGSASCSWNWDSGTAEAAGVSATAQLLGEDVSIWTGDSMGMDRRLRGAERAYYKIGQDGTYELAETEPGTWKVVFRDLRLDPTAQPEEGPMTAAFLQPLGGRADAEMLSGVIAWTCQASLEPPPTPFAGPSPKCPGRTTASEPPAVVASVGVGPKVAGQIGSYTITTCSTTGSADMAGGNPTNAVDAKPGDELAVSVGTGWRIIRWEESDDPVAGDGTTTSQPVNVPEGTRAIRVAVPTRDGSSIVWLTLTMVTDDGRAVGTFPVAFLVRVRP